MIAEVLRDVQLEKSKAFDLSRNTVTEEGLNTINGTPTLKFFHIRIIFSLSPNNFDNHSNCLSICVMALGDSIDLELHHAREADAPPDLNRRLRVPPFGNFLLPLCWIRVLTLFCNLQPQRWVIDVVKISGLVVQLVSAFILINNEISVSVYVPLGVIVFFFGLAEGALTYWAAVL